MKMAAAADVTLGRVAVDSLDQEFNQSVGDQDAAAPVDELEELRKIDADDLAGGRRRGVDDRNGAPARDAYGVFSGVRQRARANLQPAQVKQNWHQLADFISNRSHIVDEHRALFRCAVGGIDADDIQPGQKELSQRVALT